MMMMMMMMMMMKWRVPADMSRNSESAGSI